MNDKVIITYINLNKRYSTYLNKTCLQKQKQKFSITLALTILPKKKKKKKKKNYGFNFIWSLALGALSVVSGGTSLSFSLEAPPTGKVVKAKACSKL